MFTSCDKEGNDSVFDDKENIGKPEFELKVQDSVYFRSDVVAYLGANNHLTIMVDKLGKPGAKGETGLDNLVIELADFQKATFPFAQDGRNKNVANYLMNFVTDLPEMFSSINTKSVNNGKAGTFTISSINTYANVINGEFAITLQPHAFNEKNTEPIKVSGSFVNIPFVREGSEGSREYMYAIVDTKEASNLTVSASDFTIEVPVVDDDTEKEDEKVTVNKIKGIKVNGKDKAYSKFNLDIIFSEDIALNVKHTAGFSVGYISKYGEKYNNIDDNLLKGSYLRIDRKENKVIDGKNVQEIAGRFEFNLKNNLGTAETQISQGEFVVYKSVK
jgi:hypothetical protein